MILITDQFDYLTFNLLIVLPRYRLLAFWGGFVVFFHYLKGFACFSFF